MDQPAVRPDPAYSPSAAICSGSCRGRGSSAAPIGGSCCPDLRRTLLQIGIGTVDRCLASLSIFMLLPDSPGIGFVTVVVVFVVATLLGTISHTPGSLGVVEAAMLIGLPQYPREELAGDIADIPRARFFSAAALATMMFGLRELRLVARRAQSRRAETAPTL